MKILHRMILRMLLGPFFVTLGILMFLLLMQFLMRRLPDLVGKGLDFSVMLEIILYNLAYMAVLAVPMSVLVMAIFVFGQLSESEAYVVMKGAGLSLMQVLWPTVVVGLLAVVGMTHFNNNILPESNYRAKALWQDIRNKKPGFALQPGVFYDGLRGYSIRAMDIFHTSNELEQITIFDFTEGNQRSTTIVAQQGQLQSGTNEALHITLAKGEIHRRQERDERYEWFTFSRFHKRFDTSDLTFERSDPTSVSRSDRTTRTAVMQRMVDSLEADITKRRHLIRQAMQRFTRAEQPVSHSDRDPFVLEDQVVPADSVYKTTDWLLSDLTYDEATNVYDRALSNSRATRAEIDNLNNAILWASRRADRYRVEIHKKYSIAFACLVFLLIAAPLGLRIRRGGVGTVSGLSVGIFLFYWITLVQGEKLADRGFLEPWIGMWAANILVGAVAFGLFIYVGLDLRNRRWFSRK